MMDTDSLASTGVWIGINRKPMDVLEWASTFGNPRPTRPGGPLLDHLRPIQKAEAPARSLSELHGRGAFPLHTDAAHHRVPPRLTVLRLAMGTRTRQTLLLDWYQACNHELYGLMRAGIWLVRSGRHRFYRSALDQVTSSQYRLRYDDGCMTPVTPRACSAVTQLQGIATGHTIRRIDWTQGMVMVLDNWRMLHGRARYTGQTDENWTLDRVLLDPKPGMLP